MTTTISDYRVLDSEGNPISFNVFQNEQEAQEWLVGRKEDIDTAVSEEWIAGVSLVETKIPARFNIARRGTSPNYYGFGTRELADVGGYKIIGTPVEHAKWQAMRLASGLNLSSRSIDGYETLEEAMSDAKTLAGL